MVHFNNDWDEVLAGEFDQEYYKRIRYFLKQEYAEQTVYPPMEYIFNALRLTPYSSVKAVILGQDPYHGPGQAHGLCFSVQPGVKVPPSLQNIYKELKSDLGIEPLLKKYPYEVSGGQKQRAAVARALITRPQILLADEPTGALDSRSTDELLKLFAEINHAGQTVVMVTHSVRAASCASRVLFLRDGEVSLELTRGKDTDAQFYQCIADALTQQQTGGECA